MAPKLNPLRLVGFGVAKPDFRARLRLKASSANLCTLAQNPRKYRVETFRIDYLIRTPKVEKLSLQPISLYKV